MSLLEDEDENGRFTSSVFFEIEPQLEEYRFETGNPNSGRTIDLNDAFNRQSEIVKNISNFTKEIKSLCFRLDKTGYEINYYSFDGVTVKIGFIVDNEKIRRND